MIKTILLTLAASVAMFAGAMKWSSYQPDANWNSASVTNGIVKPPTYDNVPLISVKAW